jgi:hypothetical protein
VYKRQDESDSIKMSDLIENYCSWHLGKYSTFADRKSLEEKFKLSKLKKHIKNIDETFIINHKFHEEGYKLAAGEKRYKVVFKNRIKEFRETPEEFHERKRAEFAESKL